MRRSILKMLLIFSLFPLTGCWDKAELNERAFVQALAIDLNDEGKIELTTLFYKPGGAGGELSQQAQGGPRSFNIKTVDDTALEAVRDITIHLGRKAQFSHMRVILISEKLAKKRKVGEVLDAFSRDHEPRGVISVMIMKGKANDYLNIEPFIESTIGEQLRSIEEGNFRYSGKTIKSTFMELSMQLKSETGVAKVPYLYLDKKGKPTATVAGIALLDKGKMAGLISSKNAEGLLMLANQYGNGIIEFPCTDPKKEKRNKKESFEIGQMKTEITPKIIGDSVNVHVSAKIGGSVGDLLCSKLETKEQEQAFAQTAGEAVKREMEQVIELLQKKKLDAIGIGDRIYRKDSRLWQRWKPNWGERFARIQFEIDVEVKVRDTGMNIGKPMSG
ncbi:Ger(x)C family spore germination protein [Paenibacillus alkaliterrae]|uniref:Ger(x)C family spore germination protein n=1 Tax=Paenibacillus alkaliterrae TaxID=320909 RepID=UPI001F181A4F|nr:Ger(x)C family spore germination protein [Paenibacillus alkaliterrae]MCF2937956.1 Ger(x)C family spore germination protein [Paenibacillus alkaliterrae]